jgi:transcriptional regulator with XRE-family HTH domain
MTGQRDDRNLSAEERQFAAAWTRLVTRDGDAQEKTARALGMTESKMSRYCRGRTLPSDDDMLALLNYRKLGLDERAEMLQLLARAGEAKADRKAGRKRDRRASWRAFLMNHKVAAAAIILIVAGVVAGALIRLSPGEAAATQAKPTPMESATASAPGTGTGSSPSSSGWPAKVVNTWSPDSKNWDGFKGVNVYRDPYETGRDSKVDAYQESRAVSVVCQERHGREITNPALHVTSPVWDKLAEGVWISDLYTDLPKVTGDAPPLGIPTCPRS